MKVSTSKDPDGKYLHWSDEFCRPIGLRKAYRDLDERIDDITAKIKAFERANKLVYGDELLNHLHGRVVREIVREAPFYAQLKQLIQEAHAGKIVHGKKGLLYKRATLVHWELCYNKLKEWRPDLHWDITMQDYHQFLEHCRDRNWQPNYIGTIIKIWKALANIAFERGWHTNTVYMRKAFEKKSEEVKKLYLNEKHIQALIDLPLLGTDKEIRDRYIIQLNTGLRIGDMNRLRIQDCDTERGIIRSFNRKTGLWVAIDMNDDVRRILNEYQGLPRVYCEAVINRTLKQIAMQAGLLEPFRYTETKGGKEVQIEVPMWKKVTTHTARRSFITNHIFNRTPLIEVSLMAGSTTRNLERYNKLSSEDIALKRSAERSAKMGAKLIKEPE